MADEVRQHQVHAAVSDRVVWRICRDNGWWSVFGKPAIQPVSEAHGRLSPDDFYLAICRASSSPLRVSLRMSRIAAGKPSSRVTK